MVQTILQIIKLLIFCIHNSLLKAEGNVDFVQVIIQISCDKKQLELKRLEVVKIIQKQLELKRLEVVKIIQKQLELKRLEVVKIIQKQLELKRLEVVKIIQKQLELKRLEVVKIIQNDKFQTIEFSIFYLFLLNFGFSALMAYLPFVVYLMPKPSL